jgi:hypothetical protein
MEIIESRWDSNGSFRVAVAGPWPRTAKGERAARDKARQADPMRLTQWTRLDRVTLEDAGAVDSDGNVRVVYHFTVSRLGCEYR